MARSDIRTLLPLDRWSHLMGIDPLHFNQLQSNNFNNGESCGSTWYQHPWQGANRVSRDDIAIAIQTAEHMLADDVGYHLLPDWDVDEIIKTIPLRNPTAYSSGYNVRGTHKSAFAHWGHIISGGIQTKAFIGNMRIAFTDEDGDGYKETVTGTIATIVTDPDEIRLYYAGKSGDDAWEIRPISVSISGGTATIVFKAWQIVVEDPQEIFNAAILDADLAASYESTVDVYQVHLYPYPQLSMLWENLDDCVSSDSSCGECGHYAQDGCMTVRDNRLGEFAYKAATWNTLTELFTGAECVIARDPDRVQISYLSGWRDMKQSRPSNVMDPYWERVVAYLAASLLDKQICDCNNAAEFVGYWRDDLARNNAERTFQMAPERIANKFGTTRGADFALRACQAPGRRIGR